MPTISIRLVAAVIVAVVGLPSAPIPQALHEAADSLVAPPSEAGPGEAPLGDLVAAVPGDGGAGDLRGAALGESPPLAPGRAGTPSREFAADVERWRSLVALHFPDGWTDWALRIIACESGGNPAAKNRRSSATGLFQFLRSTWNWVSEETGAPRFRDGGPQRPWWNVRNAAWLLDNGGPGHWECRARR